MNCLRKTSLLSACTVILISALLASGCASEDGSARLQKPDEGSDAGERDSGAEGGDAAEGEGDAAGGEGEGEVVPDRCEWGWEETTSEHGEFYLDQAIQTTHTRCASDHYYGVFAKDTRLSLRVDGFEVGTKIHAFDKRGLELTRVEIGPESPNVEFWVENSGEFEVVITPPEESEGDYGFVFSCIDGCGRTATRYPIVLVHGLLGTDEYLNVVEYFHMVPGAMREAGFVVYNPASYLIAHSEERAPVLIEQFDAILAETGAEKMHLIGHSQGGLDMRVIVSGHGYADKVASMTTFATPHHGMNIELPEFLTGMNFHADYMRDEFAPTYPDVEDMPRFSWAGRTCSRLQFSCHDEAGDERVDLLLSATYQALRLAHRNDDYDGANDGIVPVQSQIWGEFLGIIAADHFDEVGQLLDRADSEEFNHIEFYVGEGHRLRQVEIDRGL